FYILCALPKPLVPSVVRYLSLHDALPISFLLKTINIPTPVLIAVSAILNTGSKNRSSFPPNQGTHCGQTVSIRGKYNMSTTLPGNKLLYGLSLKGVATGPELSSNNST